MTQPLTAGQKALNQRLLAEHCVSEDKLRSYYQQLSEHYDMGFSRRKSNGNSVASDIEHCLAKCNKQLKYLGLEIVTMKWQSKRYTAIRNMHADSVIQHMWSSQYHHYSYNSTTHTEQMLMRKILQTLAEEGSESHQVLVNLRSEVENCRAAQVEAVIDRLVSEKWIQKQSSANKSKSDDNDENTSSRSRKNSQIRYELAPRSYLELSSTLVDEWGMDADNLPQTIYHAL